MRSNVGLDEFVIMPKHMHDIIDVTMRVTDSPIGRVQRASTLGDIVRAYKSALTRCIQRLNDALDLRVWQRNSYKYIIRNEAEYFKISDCIQTNPQR